jgi:hypothetical protein
MDQINLPNIKLEKKFTKKPLKKKKILVINENTNTSI